MNNILEYNNVKYSAPIKPLAYNEILANNKLKLKVSPEDLANDINGTEEGTGASIFIINDKYRIQYATNNFYLITFSFSLKERAQVVNSFSLPILSFFDESVKIYSFQCVAVDAATTDNVDTHKNFKYSSILQLYNDQLRATALVKNNNIGVLKIANHTIYGYPLNLNTSYDSNQDKIAGFNMNWAVAKHDLSLPGVVESSNLSAMTKPNSVSDSTSSVLLVGDYLSTYITNIQISIGLSTAQLKKYFKISDMEENINLLNESLVSMSAYITPDLYNYSDLRLILTESLNLLHKVNSDGNWILYMRTGLETIEKLTLYYNKLRKFII